MKPDPAVTVGFDWMTNIPKRSSSEFAVFTGLTLMLVDPVDDEDVAGLPDGSKGFAESKLLTAIT